MTQQAWADWAILQDQPEGASVSVAELMPETLQDSELGEIDDESVAGSVASQKHNEVVFDQPGMPIATLQQSAAAAGQKRAAAPSQSLKKPDAKGCNRFKSSSRPCSQHQHASFCHLHQRVPRDPSK